MTGTTSQGRRSRTTSARTSVRTAEIRTAGRRQEYVRGNVVEMPAYMPEEVRRRPVKTSTTVRKNREKAVYMNLGYVAFLTAALLFAAVTLCGYIGLQSDVTNQVKKISTMEAQYNDLKLANDEEYSRINSNIDLDKIKAIAIGKLGMTYASEGQIVRVQDDNKDYVHQVADLPQK